MNDFPAAVAVPLAGRSEEGDFVLSVHELGEGPAVVFCHGFPDLACTWRHQLPVVAAAGFRAIAPDQRGYGASSRPQRVDAYGLTELTGDLIALLDALEIERAVFVGHDWGGFVAWSMPVLHPQRVAGVVGVCTPYIPFPTVDVHSALVGGKIERQYVAWFQQPGVAEAHMNRNVRVIFDRIMRRAVPPEVVMKTAMADGELNMNPFLDVESIPPLGEPLLPNDEFEHYCRVYSRTGFTGGINWYRNIDRNVREHPSVGAVELSLPCLMVMAEWDPALPPAFAASMPERCTDLEMRTIAKAGHWLQQEYPEELNRLLTTWLNARL